MVIARPLLLPLTGVNWRWTAPGRQHGRGGPSPTPFNVKAVQGIRQTVHKAVFCISVKSDISYRSGRWRVWTKFSERVYNVRMQLAQSTAFGVGKIVQTAAKRT